MTKLQQSKSAGNSYFTTLPKVFVESLGWKKGTKLLINMGSKSLIIKKKPKRENGIKDD